MRILFIGNSYTYFNDMPKLFLKECEKKGAAVRVDSVTAGGYTLAQHLSEDNECGKRIRALLAANKYDYIVLQEQSVLPAIDKKEFLRCISEFTALIKANGARPALYQTWGRADWSDTLKKLGTDHDVLHAELRRAYETAAAKNGAVLVYAGDAFDRAYKAGEPVFDPDGSHPSPLGSLIIAREFCKTLV